ncbi:MAG: radical SAM protein [Candidatus Woesearchaeota archaeon]
MELNKKLKLIKEIIKQKKYISMQEIRENLLNNWEEINFKKIKNYWKEILKNTNKNHKINLYIHIPFCKTKCFYCREDSTEITKKFNEKKYLEYLIKYINNFLPIFKNHTINSLHIGGGTPSILSTDSIKKLLNKINDFDFDENAQKTFELNPNSINKNKLNILKKNGINRISFGIQSLNEKILKNVGRINPPIKQLKEIIDYSTKLNFNEINVDLILGLKNENQDLFLKSFEKVCQMKPKRIYVYQFMIPNKNYIKNFYNNNIDIFKKEINKLYSEKLNKKLITISKKYGYTSPSNIIIKNKIGFTFNLKNKETKKTNHYEYITPYPSSCLGIGIKSRSRINKIIEYKDNGEKIIGSKINKNFEIITLLIRKVMQKTNIDLKEINNFYDIDLLKKYKNEINYLKNIKIIKIENNQIILKKYEEKYLFILLFLNNENLMKIFPNLKKILRINNLIDKNNEKNNNNNNNYVKIDVSGNQKAIMISKLCNNICLMCHSKTNYTKDYTTKEILNSLKKIDGSETNIQLSGGEPTIRKDLFIILKELKKNNKTAKIQINTNARMFYYKNFTKNCSNLVDCIMTEIHGLEKTHDKITQVKGSFKQTIKGINNLITEKIEVIIVVLINKLNYKELPKIAKFIKTNFPNSIISFQYTWFVENALKNKDLLFIKVNKIAPYLEKTADILKKNFNFMNFPRCIFNKKYRKHIIKQSFIIDDRMSYPIKECNICLFKKKCNGIWSNYKNLADNLKEFKPINKLK